MRVNKTAKQLHKDNKGLSLVELIVTILLMSVISSMIVLFISSSRSNYELISTESALQTEAQAASGFIYDILLEAENVDYYGGDGTLPASSVVTDGAIGSAKVLAVNNGEKVNVVLYEAEKKQLRYYTLDIADAVGASSSAITALKDKAGAEDPKYSLLADYVTGFDYSKVTEGGAPDGPYYSNLNLEFEYAGRVYRTTIDVSGRNMKGGI